MNSNFSDRAVIPLNIFLKQRIIPIYYIHPHLSTNTESTTHPSSALWCFGGFRCERRKSYHPCLAQEEEHTLALAGLIYLLTLTCLIRRLHLAERDGAPPSPPPLKAKLSSLTFPLKGWKCVGTRILLWRAGQNEKRRRGYSFSIWKA